MKRNSALLIVVLIMVLVLSLGLAACNDAGGQGEKQTFSVTIPSGEGYTVVGEATVKEGENYSFSVNIAEGYNSANMVVKVNGNTVTKTGNVFVVNSVSGNLVITVTGVAKNGPSVFNVTLPNGAGYSVSGDTTVNKGSDYSFTVTVANGYDVSTLVVKSGEATLNATSVEGNVATYTVSNVQSDIVLTATIAKIKFSVTLPSADEQVGYAVVGESEVEYGANYTFTVNAVFGYSIANAVVKNGEIVLNGTNGTYTVENVTANIVITVSGVVQLRDFVTVTTTSYDLKLSEITEVQKAAAYYMTGVSGVYQNEDCEVSADLSAVDFTQAGSYTITYKLVGHETVTATATVNIYGVPTLTVASDAIKSTPWSKTLDLDAFVNTLKGQVSAVDSLNNALSVSLKTASIAKNVYGYYDIKSYDVTFTATDKMGNVGEETVTITVNQAAFVPEISDLTIDLSNTAVKLTEYEAGVDFDLYKYIVDSGLVAVTSEQASFDTAKDGTFFSAAYLATLELGEHTFVVVLEDTYVVVKVTIADNQAPAYTAVEEGDLAYLVGESFVLPTATKNANSAQAITVKYFLGDAEFESNPTEKGNYVYTIRFYRGSEELTASRKTYNVTIVENYGWGGANVSAVANGNVALSGVAEGDSNPILSADYIAANKGDNNLVVVTVKIIDVGTTDDPSIWYVNGVQYLINGEKTYIGVSKNEGMNVVGSTFTMKLHIDENGTSSFTLRNFDGKAEVVSIAFESYDPNLVYGYADSVKATYDESGEYITNVALAIPAGNAWEQNTPALSAEYIAKIYAAGKRYIGLTPTYGDSSTSFLYAYMEGGKEQVKWDITSGGTKLIALVDNTAIKMSKVNLGNEGRSSADNLNVALTYYTQEEYDAIQAELSKAEARAKLAATMKSSDGFYNYFKIGAWCDPDTTAWGENNTSVNFRGGNFTIARNLIDDALLAGYTHMKFHLIAVAEDSSKTINEIALLTNPGDTYYWKLYGGTDTDIRIDLTVFSVEGHTSDSLIVRMRDAACADVSSVLTLSAIEFFKSEETTTWTKSASNVYIANENGTLVLDTVCAGNDAFAESDAEWFAKYFGQGNGASQRTLKVVEYATIYNGSNTRNMLFGWDGENKASLPESGYLNNFTGSTLRLAFDKDGVAQVKFDNVYANRNEWTTQFTHTDNTITVSNTCNDYELFFNNLDELKEKYESITFTITDTSALNGIVWFYYNDAALPINSSDNANPKTITLSEATRLMIHFTAVENITITYTLNPKSAN